MTYRCGIGLGMASLGMQPRDPHVECDGCGLIANGLTADDWPKAWLRDGKAPPGWRMVRTETDEGVHRRDYCKQCKGEAVTHPTPAALDLEALTLRSKFGLKSEGELFEELTAARAVVEAARNASRNYEDGMHAFGLIDAAIQHYDTTRGGHE